MASKYEVWQNLVDSYSRNHADQGLKLCKKKLQKDSDNFVYLLAQAHFLVQLGRHEEAIESCYAIKCTPKNVADPVMLSTLQSIVAQSQQALGTFNWVAGPQLSAVWKAALEYCPQHWLKEMRREMMIGSLRHGYWDLAQQLFARLSREHPHNSNFHFAWVALCQIQAAKLPSDDRMASSLKTLAYRSMKTAVDNTLAKKADAVRMIKSAKELRLATQVYGKQDYHDEMLRILNSPLIGITSDVAKNDSEFYRIKTMLLGECKRWPELKLFCSSGLDKYCTYMEKHGTGDIPGDLVWADNWLVWSSLLQSEVNSPEEPRKSLDLIQRFQKSDKWHRNAGMASLVYAVDFEKGNVLNACKSFFDVQREKVSCFEDLRSTLDVGLTKEEQAEFCQYTVSITGEQPPEGTEKKKESGYFVSSMNSLKTQYLLQYSRTGVCTEDEVEAFITKCLKIYSIKANSEDKSVDDACILAITALMKLASESSSNSTSYNLQTVCVLQLLRLNSQENFHATILEMLQARLLGLESIAMGAFAELGLREVQYDTLGHLLYSRISSIHPYPVSIQPIKAMEDRFKDPAMGMEFALKWPEKAATSTLTMLAKDIENVYFDKFAEFIDLVERAIWSFSLLQWPIEVQRIRRLTDHSPVKNNFPNEFRLPHNSDNRDFQPIVNYSNSSNVDITTGGNTPGVYWIARFQVNEILLVLLHTKTPPSRTQTAIMDKYIKHVQENSDEHSLKELTRSERNISQGWDLLTPIITLLVLGPKSPHASKDLKKDLAAVVDFLKTALLALEAGRLDLGEASKPIFTHWTLFEKWFLHLEFVKACDKLVETATALSKQKGHHAFEKVPVATLQQIKKAGKAVADTVQKEARDLRESLAKNGKRTILKAVTEGELGAMIQTLFGGEELRRYIEEMVESATEALGGILKVKAG